MSVIIINRWLIKNKIKIKQYYIEAIITLKQFYNYTHCETEIERQINNNVNNNKIFFYEYYKNLRGLSQECAWTINYDNPCIL